MDRTCLPSGTRLGELEILRVLAVGGFGIVYVARDHALHREVAVKEFMPAMLATRGEGRRVSVRSVSESKTFALGLNSFIDEAKLLARLSHPAVVKVHRFWKANGTGYMAMPYLRGPTLGDVRRSMSAPPTEAWLRKMTEPLLDALAMLHAEGYYHRDIAPDNVLVSDNGLPVLLDFGAARRVIAGRPQSVTAIVKPHFAPIEQYAEARLLRQGPWTDIYALGALVAYLLDGVPPPASTARTLHDEMQPLSGRRMPGFSANFLAAIDWALAVRPQDRPQSVAQLRAALDGRLVAPPCRRADALMQAPAVPQARAVLGHNGFANTVQLARSEGSDAEERAPADAAPAVSEARSAPPPRFVPRRWAWAAAATAGMVVFGLYRPPLGDLAAPTASSVAAAPASTRAEVLAFENLIASLQTAAPAEASERVEPRQPVEEFIEGPAEKIIPPEPAPLLATATTLTTTAMTTMTTTARPLQVAHAQPLGARAVGHKAAGAAAIDVKTKRSTDRRAGPRQKTAVANARLPGPVQLCAERNFFVRGWCVQRRCDEPRFAGHPQCERRQVANLMP